MKNIFLTPRKERTFYQKAIALFLAVSMNLSVGGLGVFLLPSMTYAATELITNGGFEASPSSTGWSLGSKWNVTSSRDHAGARSAEVKGSTTPSSVLSQSPMSTSGYNGIHGQFWYHADGVNHAGDSVDGSLESSDYVKAEYTLNGSTWTTFYTINDANDNGGWHQVDFDFPSGASNNSSFGIHFVANLNSASSDQVNIDDVSVIGTPIDTDSDGIPDTSDNCPSVANPNQANADGDDLGDACDTESDIASCTDGLDNDGDQAVDLLDSNCLEFKPTLTVIKNVVGGPLSAENFILHVNDGSGFPGNANGTMFAYTEPTQYSVTEDAAVDYNATFSADCNSSVAVNEHKTCTVTNSHDLCANIEGNQSEVPSGYVRSGLNCVPIPPPQSCEIEMIALDLVSGTATHVGSVTGPTAAPLSFIHSAWTASIPLATWIWATDPVADPVNQTTESFFDVFDLAHPLASDPVLSVATDNTYKVFVNDILVHEDANENNFQSGTQDSFTIPAADFHAGSNTIKFEVTNLAQGGGSAQSNPAGLLYKLSTQTNSCTFPSQEPVAHIIATKIVCDNESDLPNWGSGGDPIDQNTVANFLEEHGRSCRVTSGWNFQYAGQNSENPGDAFIGEAEGFTTFGVTDENGEATVDVPLVDNGEDGYQDIHLREVLKSGFIPFGMGTDNGDISAEFYCSNDVLNYDNFDYITNPESVGTYYCVAFNVQKSPEETPNIHIVKYVDGQPANDEGQDVHSFFDVFTEISHDEESTTQKDISLNNTNGFRDSFFDIFTEINLREVTSNGENESDTMPINSESCPAGKYRLIGYSSGSTLEGAADATVEHHSFVDVHSQGSNTYVIIWNETCSNDEGEPETPPVTPPSGGGGSSTYDHWGCTNPSASNFNPLSNRNDGSCQLPPAPPAPTGSSEPQGEVLGAATVEELPAGCTEYLRDYLKMGKKNDSEQVKLLQTFLNETLDAKLPVTGFFGNLTKNWVKKFQKKYHTEIIQPWLDAGYKGNISDGTGYVYKTTKRHINIMKCSELNIPFPDLTPDLR